MDKPSARGFTPWRKGERVGEDEFGNVYYQNADASRRWVIYPGLTDPTSVTATWHGWLHHTVDTLPNEQAFVERSWHKTAHRQWYRVFSGLSSARAVPWPRGNGHTPQVIMKPGRPNLRFSH